MDETEDAGDAGQTGPTDVVSVRTLAAQQGPAAIKALTEIMSKGASETAKIAAANALLDRGFGKGRIGGDEPPAPPPETIVTVRYV